MKEKCWYYISKTGDNPWVYEQLVYVPDSTTQLKLWICLEDVAWVLLRENIKQVS